MDEFRRRLMMISKKSESQKVNYLTIEALQDGLRVRFTNETSYSIDGGEWVTLGKDENSPPINIGSKISFKAELVPTTYGIGAFYCYQRFNLSGTPMSLLFGDNAEDKYDLTGYNYAFRSMFIGCSLLERVSKDFLSATVLSTGCYYNMFYGCKSLVEAPELSAIELKPSCYRDMFKNCSALVEAPELSALNLVDNCYHSMFSGCKSLSYIKAMFVDAPSRSNTKDWVSGVSSTGVFVKNKDATWNVTGANGVPSGWTVITE